MAGPRARSQPLGGRGMARGSILGRWPRSLTKQTAGLRMAEIEPPPYMHMYIPQCTPPDVTDDLFASFTKFPKATDPQHIPSLRGHIRAVLP